MKRTIIVFLRIKFLLLSLLLIGILKVQSQTINSITYSPVAPTSADTIYIYASIKFPCIGYKLDSVSIAVSPPNISVIILNCVPDGYGCFSAIVDYTDTIKIAPLTAGSYTLNLQSYAPNDGDPCTTQNAPSDNSSIGITVLPSMTQSVPTLSQWGLIALSVLVLSFGVFYVRKLV